MGQCNKFFRLLPGFMQRFEKIHVWLEAKKDFRMQASGSPGGGWWIRTTEGVASRFTVCPLWPLGKSPIYEVWSWWTDSNPRPADYKSAALPAELHQQFPTARIILAEHNQFVNNFFSFSYFFLGGICLSTKKRSVSAVVRCSICGREIASGEEYWVCNGTLACTDCLPDLARQELLPCRVLRGKEDRL